jgi:hypothetical protein
MRTNGKTGNMRPMNANDQQREIVSARLEAVDVAVAQQRLEGLTVPPEVVEAMKSAARGTITVDEGVRAALRRFAHVPL